MRLRCLIVAASLAACGRVGFHATDRTDDGGGVVTGGDGSVPVVCTQGGPEICNGIDDDCDGIVDEGCACTMGASNVSESPARYTDQLVWSGAQLFQLVGDAATIGFWAVDTTAGTATFHGLFSGTAGTTGGAASEAWSGSLLGVGYAHDTANVVTFHVYDPVGGTTTSQQLDQTYPGAEVQVAWAGDHFTAAWSGTTASLVTRDVPPSGVPSSPEQVIIPSNIGVVTSYLVTPTGAIACFVDGNSLATVAVIPMGQPAQTVPLPLGHGSDCELLPIPGGYVAWLPQPATQPVSLAFLDPAGNVTSVVMLPDVTPQSYGDIAIATTPTGLWIVALRIVASYSYAIDRIDLDYQGQLTSGPTQLTTFSAYLFSPPHVVATAGREIWTYQGDFNSGSPFAVAQACP